MSVKSRSGQPRHVLVTGAGRNIGRRIAEVLADRGDRVTLNARSSAQITEVADRIRHLGGDATARVADVGNVPEVRALVASAAEQYGPVDVVVHAASARVHRPFLEISLQEWTGSHDVVLNGGFALAQATLPAMVERGWGRLLMFAGVGAERFDPERAPTVSAKQALIALTKVLAREFASDGVTANVVSPGIIDTQRGPWTSSSGDGEPEVEAMYRSRAARIPAGRMGTADEVSDLVAFLTSDSAGFITGQVIRINGGSYVG